MEVQYHVYKSFFPSGWIIKDSKSAVLYSMNAEHLYKHEAGRKQSVADIHVTDDDYYIQLDDPDEPFLVSSYLPDSSTGNVSFEFEDQKFRWDRSASTLASPSGLKAVARFDRTPYSIAKIGCLHVGFGSYKIAAILTTIFIAQRLLRKRGARFVLSMLTEAGSEEQWNTTGFDARQRWHVENEYALRSFDARM